LLPNIKSVKNQENRRIAYRVKTISKSRFTIVLFKIIEDQKEDTN
jgi:ribosomal protein S6